jgi:hypothetical protein
VGFFGVFWVGFYCQPCEQEILPATATCDDKDKDKYHTVGTRDGTKFQGIRDKIVQWNNDLKKRMSTENLAAPPHSRDTEAEDSSMFVTATPQQHGQVKSAVVVVANNSRQDSLSPWSTNSSPSPPVSDSDSSTPDHRRSESSYRPHPAIFQDQDSGYDGYCPEQSIYSTASSDSSSVISSEADTSLPLFSSLYGRSLARPRPSPIYEKDGRDASLCKFGTTSPRSRIAQATVINLVRSQAAGGGGDASLPPPLPPRPSSRTALTSLPPLHNPKPALGIIRQGAVSLPRRRPEVQERARLNEAPAEGDSRQQSGIAKNKKVK